MERRNEVLGFLAGEVRDLSVSRPVARAAGWGIPAPGDAEQLVYVWFDALANYLSGLGYGTPDDGAYWRWWAGDTERVHVVGKGIVWLRVVYWIALLLSVGLPLPTPVLVHDYPTVDGPKIAKSGPQAADPATPSPPTVRTHCAGAGWPPLHRLALLTSPSSAQLRHTTGPWPTRSATSRGGCSLCPAESGPGGPGRP